ncbi:MAG: ABC transporter permease [Propionibacteriaceae bacterium]|jgi:putative ABC transport system permease protein|nr:ABC transporter permease [Propionibacteriaceae bacterium]
MNDRIARSLPEPVVPEPDPGRPNTRAFPNRPPTPAALAIKHLKSHRATSAFTLVAIALSCVLVTAVVSMGAAMADAIQQRGFIQYGHSAHAHFQKLTPSEAQAVSSHPLAASYGKTRFVGLDTAAIAHTPIAAKTMDADAAKYTLNPLVAGRLPQAEDEVAVQSWVLEDLGLPVELGQRINLNLEVQGKQHALSLKVTGLTGASKTRSQYGFALVSEQLADNLLTGVDPAETRANGTNTGMTELYVMLDAPTSRLQSAFDKLVSDTGIDVELTNSSVNQAYLESVAVEAIAAMGAGLALMAACGYLLIRNIMHISVAQDIRRFGLLKAIGATRKQIGRIVRFQALVLCVIGIPLGVALGWAAALWLTPVLMSSLAAGSDYGVVAVPWWALAASAVLSLLTVLVSCASPARVAGRTSPVEAARFSGIALPRRSTRRGTNAPSVGRLASANLFRARSKTVVSLVSVCVGLVLFSVVFAVSGGIDAASTVKNQIISDYVVSSEEWFDTTQFYWEPTNVLTEDVADAVKALPAVEDAAGVYYKREDTSVLYGFDDGWLDVLEKAVVKGTFDRQKFLTGDYAVIVNAAMPSIAGAGAAQQTEPWNVGNKVELHPQSTAGKTYEVMAAVDYDALAPLSAHGVSMNNAIVPASEMRGGDAELMMLGVFASPSAELEAALDTLAATVDGLQARSRADYLEETQGMIQQLVVVGGALSLMVLAVGLLNFATTTTTGIMSRRRELAMLQAVGMSPRQCKAMLTLEGLSFVGLCLVFFATVGTLAGFGVVSLLSQANGVFRYQFSALPLLATAAPLLLLGAALPRVVYRTVSREPVVTRLRQIE